MARIALILLLLLAATLPAEARRVALVIGNDVYPNLPEFRQLQKAVNDARAMREVLAADLGFDVMFAENADYSAMNRSIGQVEAGIEAGDIVFLYFSGHGVSVGGENFVLPTDIPKPKEGEEKRLAGASFGIEELVLRMKKRGARAVYAVIDACRDNPFENEAGKSVAGPGGLTNMDASEGVFILFAAGVRQTALDRLSEDDANPNSVFTRSLIPALKTGGLSQVDLAKRVYGEVKALAASVGHAQNPAYYDQLEGFVVLKEGSIGSVQDQSTSTVAEPGKDALAAAGDDVGLLTVVAERFAGSVWGDLAKAKIAKLKQGDTKVAMADKVDLPPRKPQRPIRTIKVDSSLFLFAFSPDSASIIVGCGDGIARIFESSTGQLKLALNGHGGSVRDAVFSPDGTRIATGSDDKTARVWDASSGRLLEVLAGHSDVVRTVAFSPDGELIATASNDSTIRVWNVKTGDLIITLVGHTDPIGALAFSPDGKRLVSGSSDKTAILWEIATGNSLLLPEGHENEVYPVAFSPDGTRILTGDSSTVVRVWDAATGALVLTLEGHTGVIYDPVFSPDGTRIVTASADKTARVWNAATGEQLFILDGHTDTVWKAAFSPDGKNIVTGSSDKTVRIWDAATGWLIKTLSGHTDMVWLIAFSPDGAYVATGTNDPYLRIWDMAEASAAP
jgi:WD40 repeat protein